MKIALLRHGPTEWNAVGRIQGHTDVFLSEDGRRAFSARALPQDLRAPRIFVSPLARARQTADLLGLYDVVEDRRLIEQNWGQWEGFTREEILARDGPDALIRAGYGSHFRPLGGESTGEVIARVRAFLADAAAGEGDGVAVTHLGVLRAAYTIASNWTMDAPMPSDLDAAKILVLALEADAKVTIAELNRDFSKKA